MLKAREPLQGLANCTSVMEENKETIHDKARSFRGNSSGSSISNPKQIANFLPTYIHIMKLCVGLQDILIYIDMER